MRLKKLTCGIAVAGMAAGMAVVGGVGTAHATQTTIYPFFDFSLGAATGDYLLVGSTDPGNAGSELCLNGAANGSGALIDGTAGKTPADANYSGKVNGSGSGTLIDQLIVKQDFLTAVPACTGTEITHDDAGTTTAVTDAVKHKGTITLVDTAAVQNGILAGSNTVIRVHKQSTQVVTLPGGSSAVAPNNNAGAGSTVVDIKLKQQVVKVKSLLNTGACEDVDSVVTLTIADDKNGNRTQEINSDPAESNGATHTYSAANAATKNVITIRECAQSDTVAAGKAISTKVNIVGAGVASADFMYALTSNPRTWDTTRGATCSDSKSTVTANGHPSGEAPAAPAVPITGGARVFNCKGDYGQDIPFVIAVRGITNGTPDHPGKDPKGLVHKLGPVAYAGSSINIP